MLSSGFASAGLARSGAGPTGFTLRTDGCSTGAISSSDFSVVSGSEKSVSGTKIPDVADVPEPDVPESDVPDVPEQVNEVKVQDQIPQQDLGFVLFLAFIFDKRTINYGGETDKNLTELTSWLKTNKKINTDVEPCQPVHLSLSDADSPRLIDALNKYSPDFPISMVLDDSSHAYITKRLNIWSPSIYSYQSGSSIDIPLFHGGKINVIGDVNFDSIVDLINSQNVLSFTTEINVSGTLIGCDNESVNLAVKHLRDGIYDMLDENIHGFVVRGVCNSSVFVKTVRVRNWVISFEQFEKSVLEVSRV